MPYRLVFILITFCLFVVSLPREYSSPIAHTCTAFFASFLNRSDTSRSPCPDNKELEGLKQEAEEEYREVIDYSARALGEKYSSIVAQVIFQTQSSWTHTLWIDKGSKTKDLPFPLKKNCPVLVEDSLVGIVDFVGKYASRIRLISDPQLRPSVRATRGGYMSRRLFSMAQDLQKALQEKPHLMPKEHLSEKLSTLLKLFASTLHHEIDLRLAKGELQGAESSKNPHIFRGAGFNYDFDDDEGQKMDLRTGQRHIHDVKTPIIKPGDILETSGLDGFFPKNIKVAVVTKVFPLEEGAIAYSILAKSLIHDFSSLEYVTIIPAQPEDVFHPQTKEENILSLIQSVRP